MTIESGIYSGYRNQQIIMLVVIAAFAAWFARDGWQKYPADNLKWAQQQLPAMVPGLSTNPKALKANLQKVQPGMPVGELRTLLGEPALVHEGTEWYVGPAAYAGFQVADGKVAGVIRVEESREPSESDIQTQKYFAVGLGVIAVVMLLRLVKALRTRFVVDDQGVHIGGTSVAWSEITALDAGDYARKGRVRLVYQRGGQTDSLVLNSNVIDKFGPIVAEICQRKGFTSPLPAAKAAQPG